MLTGPNGLINQAQEAKTLTEEAEAKEKEDLNNIMNEFMENGDNGTGNTGVTLEQVNQLIEQAIQGAKLEPYPVGSIYISINKTNPEELFGGTWETWGSGRVPVGVDDNQTEFNTVEKNGGEKNVALTVNQMPKHSHTFSGTTSTASLVGRFMAEAWNTHWADGIVKLTVPNPNLSGTSGNGFGQGNYTIDASHSHTVTGTIGEAGGGGAHNNLQPYITCYMWKRTA